MRKNIVNSTINGSYSPLLGENGPFLCQNLRFLQKKYSLRCCIHFLVQQRKQIQDIEKESNEKQEPKSVDEMILEQPQLLRDVNFVQQNYDAVSKAVNAQPSLMQYIGSQNGLTPSAGVFYGPSGKETYYNLDISGVISIMRGMGNNDEYWVRMDGAKMLGDYIMVAADLNKHPRGSIVETSLGQGIVCDTGSFTYTSDTQLDIATNW